MTAAALGKSDLLRRRFDDSRRLTAPAPRGQTQAGGGGAAAAAAAPRRCEVVVTVCGAVLSRAHAKAGSYVAREEREEAARLCAGEPGGLHVSISPA
jgi:hypothetical protein